MNEYKNTFHGTYAKSTLSPGDIRSVSYGGCQGVYIDSNTKRRVANLNRSLCGIADCHCYAGHVTVTIDGTERPFMDWIE